jgi:hypothetical protein
VTSGGTLRLHYLTNQASFRVNLWRQGAAPSLVYQSGWFDSGPGLAAAIGPMDTNGNVVASSRAQVWTDWQWPHVDIAIDPTWPPGVRASPSTSAPTSTSTSSRTCSTAIDCS